MCRIGALASRLALVELSLVTPFSAIDHVLEVRHHGIEFAKGPLDKVAIRRQDGPELLRSIR